jgi:hypothetical protein
MKTSIIYKNVYRFLFPLIIVFLLLFVSSILKRPFFFNSIFIDLMLRIFISVYFGFTFYRLSEISKIGIYPNKKWNRSDVGPIEKYILISVGIVYGIFQGFIFMWAINTFLPNLIDIKVFISVVVGFAISIPIILNYWIIKI